MKSIKAKRKGKRELRSLFELLHIYYRVMNWLSFNVHVPLFIFDWHLLFVLVQFCTWGTLEPILSQILPGNSNASFFFFGMVGYTSEKYSRVLKRLGPVVSLCLILFVDVVSVKKLIFTQLNEVMV